MGCDHFGPTLEHIEGLGQLGVALVTKVELEQRLAPLATKAELEIWGGALLARIESSEQRLLIELARHTGAIQESMSKQISVIDESTRICRHA